MTLEQLSTECQRITNIKVDSALIANASGERVLAVNSGGYSTKSVQKPLNACWLCSGQHWKLECPYRSHECADSGRYGHREGHCEVVNRFQRR